MTITVTFPVSLGCSGLTISDDDDPTTGFGNNGHSRLFFPTMQDLVIACQSGVLAGVAATTAAGAAAVSATNAANSAAASAGISVGRDLLSAPRNADLGACAFMSVEQLPLCIYPLVLSGAYTLVANDFGDVVLSNGFNITLPAAARCPIPWAVQIKNTHASTSITVTRAGSDTIDGTTSITLTAGASRMIIKSATGAFVSL
jgi:hypothetical protein